MTTARRRPTIIRVAARCHLLVLLPPSNYRYGHSGSAMTHFDASTRKWAAGGGRRAAGGARLGAAGGGRRAPSRASRPCPSSRSAGGSCSAARARARADASRVGRTSRRPTTPKAERSDLPETTRDVRRVAARATCRCSGSPGCTPTRPSTEASARGRRAGDGHAVRHAVRGRHRRGALGEQVDKNKIQNTRRARRAKRAAVSRERFSRVPVSETQARASR